MNNQQAYDAWSEIYDTNHNKTRDLEARVLRELLDKINVQNLLEIGCGTGKNTVFLKKRTKNLVALDFSQKMLDVARQKIKEPNVEFRQQDITKNWNVESAHYQFITFSLVLEHIENLDFVFQEAAKALDTGGGLYIGEFHPFRQYQNRKARFETENGDTFELECFTHHVSEFTELARKNGFVLKILKEYFDENNTQLLPRILGLVFEKL